MIGLFFGIVILIFLAGITIVLLGAGRDSTIPRTLSLACTAGDSALLALFALFILITNTSVTFTALQPFPGIQVAFFIDRLAAFFLFLIGVVTACVAVYGTGYIEHMEGEPGETFCAAVSVSSCSR